MDQCVESGTLRVASSVTRRCAGTAQRPPCLRQHVRMQESMQGEWHISRCIIRYTPLRGHSTEAALLRHEQKQQPVHFVSFASYCSARRCAGPRGYCGVAAIHTRSAQRGGRPTVTQPAAKEQKLSRQKSTNSYGTAGEAPVMHLRSRTFTAFMRQHRRHTARGLEPPCFTAWERSLRWRPPRCPASAAARAPARPARPRPRPPRRAHAQARRSGRPAAGPPPPPAPPPQPPSARILRVQSAAARTLFDLTRLGAPKGAGTQTLSFPCKNTIGLCSGWGALAAGRAGPRRPRWRRPSAATAATAPRASAPRAQPARRARRGPGTAQPQEPGQPRRTQLLARQAFTARQTQPERDAALRVSVSACRRNPATQRMRSTRATRARTWSPAGMPARSFRMATARASPPSASTRPAPSASRPDHTRPCRAAALSARAREPRPSAGQRAGLLGHAQGYTFCHSAHELQHGCAPERSLGTAAAAQAPGRRPQGLRGAAVRRAGNARTAAGPPRRACATSCMRSTAMPRDAAALSRKERYANSAVASNSASSSGVKLRLSPSRFAYLPQRDAASGPWRPACCRPCACW